MARFYNPYHFVPVTPPVKSAEPYTSTRDEFNDAVVEGNRIIGKLENVTHERYVPHTHSGRLIVRLTTVSPTVIGAKQEPEKGSEHPRVHPFKIDGRPAIPASTLRGLIGSVIEAASNGPLRILEDRAYSFRRKMERNPLSAIGLIVEEGGTLHLKPMCLPTLESKDGGRTFAVEPRFKNVFPTPQFKVFFGNRAEIRSPLFQYTTHTSTVQAVQMPVKQLTWNGNAVAFDDSLHVKANRYAVAQDPDTRDPQRLGMVRVLGCQGKARESIPFNKTHELWLPLPDPKGPVLKISPVAIERFEQLADERTDDDPALPFEPKGTRPSPDDRGAGKRLRLRAGDMVYFDVDASRTVTELSFSAIWRGRVEDKTSGKAASTWTFFNTEQRPFNPERKSVSLAEQLLGFAEEFPPKTSLPAAQERGEAALSLASRLSFADAQLPEGVTGGFDPLVTLRILDSPKLPCPSLYFKDKNGQGSYIAKQTLDPTRHSGQGRKWYLHSRLAPGDEPWKTLKAGNEKQKGRVEPLKAGQSFFFHIDCDNLSNIELGLLLYSIEPSPTFHHKLGMGKPLGLGTVKLEVVGYFPIDRARRYTLEGLSAGRYSAAELTEAGEPLIGRDIWPKRYAIEAESPPSTPAILTAAREELLNSKLIPQEIHEALVLLGDYATAPPASAVHYPTIAGQFDKEADHYEWFVFNDGKREHGRGKSPSGQFLKPLARRKALPDLEEMA